MEEIRQDGYNGGKTILGDFKKKLHEEEKVSSVDEMNNNGIKINNNFNGDEITQKFAANSTLNYKKIILFLTSFQYLTLVLPCHIYRLI